MINYFHNLSNFLIKNGIIEGNSEFKLIKKNQNGINSISNTLIQLLKKTNPRSKIILIKLIRIITKNIR